MIKRLAGLLLVVAVIGGGVAMWAHGRSRIVADNAYITGEVVTLRAPFSGRFDGFSKYNGDAVEAGEPLAEFEPEPLRQAVEVARLDLEKAVQTEIQRCLGVQESEGDIAIGRLELDEARRTRDRYRALMARRLITAEQMEKAERTTELARLRIQRLGDVRSGQAIDLDVPVLERVQVLGMAEAYLKAEYRQQQARLVSPSDGVIYRIHAHPGDMLREGDPLLAIVPTGSRFVEALVLETDLSRIDLDRPVRVLPASGHGVELRGWVRRIMPSAASVFSPLPRNNIDSNWVKVTQRVPVMIALEARGDAGLLPLGTSARVEFPVRREPGALRVTAVDKAEKRGRAPEMRYRAPALDVAPLLDALATRYAHTRIGACRLR